MTFFATAARGTEPALRDELRELRFRGVRADRGGVHFDGALEEAARACMWSRIAMRVLVPLAEFHAPDEDALYDGIYAIDWLPFLTPDRTLAVRSSARDSGLSHTQYIAQRTKDAIVDQIRDREGDRPSVDLDDPDVGVFVHLVRDRATVYADASGQPLHKRGYRLRQLEAPLKETLAAAVVRLSGWNGRVPFADPMCGSGTLAIEAALWARDVAPGLGRERFGLERWAMHDAAGAEAMARLRAAARAAARPEGPAIFASDASSEAVEATLTNALAAGVSLRVEQRGVEQMEPLGASGQIVVNPPYGARLAEEEGLYRQMGAALARLSGHRAAILAGTPAIEEAIPLRPAARHTVYNGAIECRVLVYEIG